MLACCHLLLSTKTKVQLKMMEMSLVLQAFGHKSETLHSKPQISTSWRHCRKSQGITKVSQDSSSWHYGCLNFMAINLILVETFQFQCGAECQRDELLSYPPDLGYYCIIPLHCILAYIQFNSI